MCSFGVKCLTYLYSSLPMFKIKIVMLHHQVNAWLTVLLCFPHPCSLHSPLEKGQWTPYIFISGIQFRVIVDCVFMVGTCYECVFQKSTCWKLNFWIHRLMVCKSEVFQLIGIGCGHEWGPNNAPGSFIRNETHSHIFSFFIMWGFLTLYNKKVLIRCQQHIDTGLSSFLNCKK